MMITLMITWTMNQNGGNKYGSVYRFPLRIHYDTASWKQAAIKIGAVCFSAWT